MCFFYWKNKCLIQMMTSRETNHKTELMKSRQPNNKTELMKSRQPNNIQVTELVIPS